MQRLAIDMDEVMADTLGHALQWLAQQRQRVVHKATLVGKHLAEVLTPDEHHALEATMHRGTFFADIPLMPACLAVMNELTARYRVFITTAAMDYPRSMPAKFAWLQRHFPQLPKERYVFCGDKQIIAADYMLDDNAHNFAHFHGQPLLFDAPHNSHVQQYERLNDWHAVRQRLLT